MVKNRIDEIIDFTRSESPYRNANKGWINDFIFLQWGKTKEKDKEYGEELADVAVYWNKELAGIVFIVGFLTTSLIAPIVLLIYK